MPVVRPALFSAIFAVLAAVILNVVTPALFPMATPAAAAALKKLYALTIYVPVTHAPQIRAALASSGAGAIGAYDSCSFSSRGIGRFRPLAGANPFIGSVGAIEEVEEEKVETEVTADRIGAVLEAVRAAHPYETPAIHVHELIDWESFVVPKPTTGHPSDAGGAAPAAASAK